MARPQATAIIVAGPRIGIPVSADLWTAGLWTAGLWTAGLPAGRGRRLPGTLRARQIGRCHERRAVNGHDAETVVAPGTQPHHGVHRLARVQPAVDPQLAA